MRHASQLMIAVSLCLSACGGGGSPSSPTPEPTVTGISLSTLDVVRLNSPQRLVLSATMSDGTSRAVEGTWQSSDQGIATIAADGLVTGVTSGETTITAQYQSFRSERRLRVVPDYGGVWNGGYRIVNCTDNGDWDGFCEDQDPDVELELHLSFVQIGGGVRGEILVSPDVGSIVDGTIAIDGRLTAAGQQAYETAEGPVVLAIAEWDTLAFDNNRRMNGHFQFVFSAPDLNGDLRYFSEITELDKMATPARTDRFRRPLVSRPRPSVPPRSR